MVAVVHDALDLLRLAPVPLAAGRKQHRVVACKTHPQLPPCVCRIEAPGVESRESHGNLRMNSSHTMRTEVVVELLVPASVSEAWGDPVRPAVRTRVASVLPAPSAANKKPCPRGTMMQHRNPECSSGHFNTLDWDPHCTFPENMARVAAR